MPIFRLFTVLQGASFTQYRALELSYSVPEMETLPSFVTVPDETLVTEPVPPIPPPALGLGLHERKAANASANVTAKTISGRVDLNSLKQRERIRYPGRDVPQNDRARCLLALVPFPSRLD